MAWRGVAFWPCGVYFAATRGTVGDTTRFGNASVAEWPPSQGMGGGVFGGYRLPREFHSTDSGSLI